MRLNILMIDFTAVLMDDSNVSKDTSNRVVVEDKRSCTTCGYQNRAGTTTCLNCGSALGLPCPVCTRIVPANNKFCTQCGAALPGNQVPAAVLRRSDEVRQNLRALLPATLVQKISAAGEILGEHREVTVLSANIKTVTLSAFPLDNEESYLLMNEALQRLVEVVYKYEGTVDKFTGDGLIALFGAPVSHENDPERAIRAALDMQAEIETWRQHRHGSDSFDIRVRVGINTGPVIAGKVGNNLHMDYTVIGETVNLAHHLHLMAESGAILVTTEAYRRTRSLIDFKILPPLTLKWLDQPVETFQVLGLRTANTELQALPVVYSTLMIGRANDLARLQQVLAAVQEHRQSRVVLVTGEAGLGKSRLVTEFRRSLAGTVVQVYQGSCLTYVRSTPLWVVSQLLRNILHLSQNEPVEIQQQALQSILAQLGLANSGIQPYLAQILGLSQSESHLGQLDPDMLQRQTHAALRQLIVAVAHQAPAVLILEDLHWVDPASRDFLKYLIQTTEDVPLLLVLISREADAGNRLQSLLAAAERALTERLIEIHLQELSAEDGRLLADQLITENSSEAQALKQQIITRAAGNPFYLEEIFRMLIDQGGLIRTADATWHVTPMANDLLTAVPGTIKGLILTRFDRLPEILRRLLQKAAVLGTSFPASLLLPLSNTSPEILMSQLGQLEARQFLSAVLFRSQPGYTFEHALLQETIYHTLLKRDRRKIHAQIGQAIESSQLWSPEEQAEVLAYHYNESTQPGRAVPYLITAAENAARRCAYETAIRHYRQAAGLLREEPASDKLAQVLFGLGRSLKHIGQFAEAGQVLLQGLAQLQGQDAAVSSRLQVKGWHQLADVRQKEGNYQQALSYLEQGLQALGEAGGQENLKQRNALLERMAWIYFRQGKLEQALNLAAKAIDDLSTAGIAASTLLAKLHNLLGGILWQQGQRLEAVAHVRQSLTLHESMGNLWGVAIAYGNLGILHDVLLGEWAKAEEYYQQANAIQQVIADIEGQGLSIDNLGLLHMNMGKHELAQHELETGLAIRQRLGDTWGTALSHVNLAHLALVQARFADVTSHAQAALTMAGDLSSAEIKVPAFWCLAMARAEQGELQPGLESARQALQMAQAAQLMEGETDTQRILGILYTRAGEYDQAETALQRSYQLAVKQGGRYRQGLARYELGRLYQQQAQVDRAAAAEWQTRATVSFEEAVNLFAALGAIYDLGLAQAAQSTG